MKKKTTIHEFDPVIYPIKLWISINPNIDEISNKFYQGLNHDNIETEFILNHTGVTYFVQEKLYPSDYGSLIVFGEKKYCNTSLIAHEATHAARDIWDHLREDKTGVEADAYLVGWIADCIDKVKQNKL